MDSTKLISELKDLQKDLCQYARENRAEAKGDRHESERLIAVAEAYEYVANRLKIVLRGGSYCEHLLRKLMPDLAATVIARNNGQPARNGAQSRHAP